MNLSQAILSGEESIVITYSGDAWSNIEITEAYATFKLEPVI